MITGGSKKVSYATSSNLSCTVLFLVRTHCDFEVYKSSPEWLRWVISSANELNYLCIMVTKCANLFVAAMTNGMI